jgi:hypothetical protein
MILKASRDIFMSFKYFTWVFYAMSISEISIEILKAKC